MYIQQTSLISRTWQYRKNIQDIFKISKGLSYWKKKIRKENVDGNMNSFQHIILFNCTLIVWNVDQIEQQFLSLMTLIFCISKTSILQTLMCCSAGTVIKSPAKVSTPFPHIFKKSINRNGFLSTNQRLPFEGMLHSYE